MFTPLSLTIYGSEKEKHESKPSLDEKQETIFS